MLRDSNEKLIRGEVVPPLFPGAGNRGIMGETGLTEAGVGRSPLSRKNGNS